MGVEDFLACSLLVAKHPTVHETTSPQQIIIWFKVLIVPRLKNLAVDLKMKRKRCLSSRTQGKQMVAIQQEPHSDVNARLHSSKGSVSILTGWELPGIERGDCGCLFTA
jgi:hypothetical protein